jgi:hypothetical protein
MRYALCLKAFPPSQPLNFNLFDFPAFSPLSLPAPRPLTHSTYQQNKLNQPNLPNQLVSNLFIWQFNNLTYKISMLK